MDTHATAGQIGSAAQSASHETLHPMKFTGTTGEYFRIWIVNLALTVATLGIYWAWAKVRNRKYLYGNTWLDGHNFEYTASPLSIFKGHLVIAVLFGAFSLSQYFNEWLYLGLLLAFGLVWPFLAHQAMRFGALNTRHRGLRFHFHGDLRGSYAAFLGWPLLLIPTFGILYPQVVWVQRRYLLGNLSFGSARANFRGDSGAVWVIHLIAFAAYSVLGIAFVMVAAVLGFGAAILGGFDPSTSEPPVAVLFAVVPIYLIGLAVSTAIFGYVQGAMLNYALSNVEVPGQVRLTASLNPIRYAWIVFSNLLAQGLTLGLATPWATVRRLNYILPHVAIASTTGMAAFTAGHVDRESALGEAASEFLGIDIGL